MTKSTKSQQGGLTPSSFRTTGGVHESVARAVRGKLRAANGKVKSDSFALPTTSAIPRVRTYHTRKPSRFVHALPARPLKVRELTDLRSKRSASPRQGKRAWGSLYADEIRAFCHPELSSLSLKSAIKEKYL